MYALPPSFFPSPYMHMIIRLPAKCLFMADAIPHAYIELKLLVFRVLSH